MLHTRRYEFTQTNLYSVLWELRLHGEHFSGVNVWIVSFIESFLQFLQLVGCENGSACKI